MNSLIKAPPTIAAGLSVRDARAMLREFMRPQAQAPKASGEIFDWCVTEASYDLEPTIITAQFGDGYAQRRPTGINSQVHKWNISIKNASNEIASEVVNFLSARNGVEIFNWTPPRTTVAQNVICPSWNLAYGDLLDDGSLLYTVTFKFEEAFV